MGGGALANSHLAALGGSSRKVRDNWAFRRLGKGNILSPCHEKQALFQEHCYQTILNASLIWRNRISGGYRGGVPPFPGWGGYRNSGCGSCVMNQRRAPPFHWRNQGLILPMQMGWLQLAGRKKQHLPCSMSLPMHTAPFSLAESGPDSANGKGGGSIGRSQEAAFTMSDKPAN